VPALLVSRTRGRRLATRGRLEAGQCPMGPDQEQYFFRAHFTSYADVFPVTGRLLEFVVCATIHPIDELYRPQTVAFHAHAAPDLANPLPTTTNERKLTRP